MASASSRFSLDTTPLTEEMKKKAEEELRETPERVQESTVALRKLVHDDKTIKFRDDDEFLIRFLRPTKFYPESAHAMMKRVAEFKDKNDWLLGGLMPANEEYVYLEHNVVNVLTERDQLGRRILVVNCGESWDPKKVTADQIFKQFYLIHQGAMLEPQTQVCGAVVIMDFLGLAMKQVVALTPAFSLRLLTFIQDAMPLRLKEVHIVNQPFLFNMVWTVFKPFVREKLKKRMFFHAKKMESLHKHLDPDCMPQDYGGTLPKIDYTSKDWYPVLVGINDNIKEWNSMGLVKEK